MGISDLVRGEDAVGLTESGVQAAVSQHCEFEGHPPGTTRSHRSVADMYRVLIERDDPVPASDLIKFFRPVDGSAARDQGRYDAYMEKEWWVDVGRPALESLPGVEKVGEDSGTRLLVGDAGTWRLVGVDPDEFNEEHTRPLDEIHEDPSVRVEQALDDLDVPRQSDERTALLDVWSHLESEGSATADDLDRVLPRSVSVPDVDSALEELPGVSRDVEHPPDPEDIEVSTMADIIEGYRELEKDPTEVWRHTTNHD